VSLSSGNEAWHCLARGLHPTARTLARRLALCVRSAYRGRPYIVGDWEEQNLAGKKDGVQNMT